jgi:hypothetical protein
LKQRIHLKVFLVWKALVKAVPSPNALFDHDWAIWRVKDAQSAPQKNKNWAVVFLRKTILDAPNRPRTITDVVCVTTKVTKTTSQAFLLKLSRYQTSISDTSSA